MGRRSSIFAPLAYEQLRIFAAPCVAIHSSTTANRVKMTAYQLPGEGQFDRWRRASEK